MKKQNSETEIKLTDFQGTEEGMKIVEQLGLLSDEEKKKLIKIIKKEKIEPRQKYINLGYGLGHIKFAVISDTHIGSIYFDDEDLLRAFRLIKKEGSEFILHAGDHSDGFFAPHRMQQIWELKDIGYTQQLEHIINLYKETPKIIYGIDGNHDETYIRLAGVVLGNDLEARLGKDKFENLGCGEGEIIFGNTIIRLRHPKTGSSYALSYRGQKYADGLTGGQKPNVVISGHLHKFFYMDYRNIAMLDAGTLCNQSRWQREKELVNHKGFSFMEIWYNKKGITRAKIDWVPYYE
jgi:predicted phosphodiesterase